MWVCQYLFEILFPFSMDTCPRSGIAGTYDSSFLNFWETSILFSTVAAPIYIPTNRREVISHCGFDMYLFPLQFVMSSTFSCTCWPFICLLWTNVYLGPLPSFKMVYLFFACWVVWVVFIFWLLTSYQVYDLQIVLPFHRLPFDFVESLFAV